MYMYAPGVKVRSLFIKEVTDILTTIRLKRKFDCRANLSLNRRQYQACIDLNF